MGNLAQNQLRILTQGRSLKTKFEAMHAINLSRNNIRQVLRESQKTSSNDLALTSRAILLRSEKGDFEEAFELATWSVKEQPEARKVVIGSFIRSRQSTLLVHQMARMKRSEATTLMRDYFEQGGDLKNVAEWLRTAGSILKTGNVPEETDGVWGWVSGAAESVVDAVAGAINTVADAVKAAGKNLAEAIAEVASWTQSKVNDFVEAIIAAGKRVSDILAEAAKKGTAVLKKFVAAVLEAGRKGLEVLNWAVLRTASIFRAVLQKLEQLYGSFTTLLLEVAKMTVTKMATTIRALISMGKRVIDFINRIERLAYHVAKRIVMEIRRAGKAVREIIAALLNKSRYVARIVLDALMSLGNSITTLLREAVNWTASRIARLIGALKDLAVSLSSILDAIARFAGTQIIRLMQALRMIWTRVRVILQFIAQKSVNTIRTLLVALLGTGIHIRNVLSSILTELRAAFRQSLIKGLIQIGKSALTLMMETVKISASAVAVLFAILMDIFGSHRGLNAAERAEAEKIFGSSIDLNKVRLTDASFAADLIMWLNENRPFTTMYVINYKSGTNLNMATLIHELTHIWQAENSGGVYMLEALHSQFFGAGYNLTDEDVRNANGKIENLEREQQAVLVEEFWKADCNGQAIPLDLELIRPLAKQVHKSSFHHIPIPVFDLDIINNRIITPVIPVTPI